MLRAAAKRVASAAPRCVYVMVGRICAGLLYLVSVIRSAVLLLRVCLFACVREPGCILQGVLTPAGYRRWEDASKLWFQGGEDALMNAKLGSFCAPEVARSAHRRKLQEHDSVSRGSMLLYPSLRACGTESTARQKLSRGRNRTRATRRQLFACPVCPASACALARSDRATFCCGKWEVASGN